MAGNTLLLWAVSSVTFVIALFAVVDQASLHQEMASQVFRIDETDQTAYLAPGIRRVVIGQELPAGGIESVPTGSVYIGAAMRFSSGHSMERDDAENLVLYAEPTPGFRTRLATFTPEGAVSLGEVPPVQNIEGGVFVTGRAVSSARDGWLMHSEANVTDTLGRVYATMGTVKNLEDPSETGVQFRTGDGTLTFSNGKVYIGYVSQAFRNAQGNNSRVLVGSDVLVESEIQALKLPVTSIDPSECQTGGYLMPTVFTYSGPASTSDPNPLQNNQSDWTVAYFDPNLRYSNTTVHNYFPGHSLENFNGTIYCNGDGSNLNLGGGTSNQINSRSYENPHYYTCFCPKNQFEINSFKVLA